METIEYEISCTFAKYNRLRTFFPQMKLLNIWNNEWRAVEIPVDVEDNFLSKCEELEIKRELVG